MNITCKEALWHKEDARLRAPFLFAQMYKKLAVCIAK